MQSREATFTLSQARVFSESRVSSTADRMSAEAEERITRTLRNELEKIDKECVRSLQVSDVQETLGVGSGP